MSGEIPAIDVAERLIRDMTRSAGRPAAVCIAGPTASGKSALALALARRNGGVVVNCDSMQVYRDLRIVTARPTPEEEAIVPHRLFGHVDAATHHSAGHYLADATALLRDLGDAMPVFVGGTGLYFRAITEGLSAIPPVPADVRERVRREAEGVETPALHARLAAVDPQGAARLGPNDRQRILRALEVEAATGRPLGAFHGPRDAPILAAERCVRLFLRPDRAALRARIDARFLAMMEAGALDEVRRLAARGLDPALPVMRAHGVPGLVAHLRGEMSLADAIAKGQADTRSYAKRQVTWFRHQMPGWVEVQVP